MIELRHVGPDDNEMILLMADDQTKIFGMWTNYSSIVKSYKILFELLWKQSKK